MLCYTLYFSFMRKISGTVIGLLEVGDIKVFVNIWKYLLHLFVEIWHYIYFQLRKLSKISYSGMIPNSVTRYWSVRENNCTLKFWKCCWRSQSYKDPSLQNNRNKNNPRLNLELDALYVTFSFMRKSLDETTLRKWKNVEKKIRIIPWKYNLI